MSNNLTKTHIQTYIGKPVHIVKTGPIQGCEPFFIDVKGIIVYVYDNIFTVKRTDVTNIGSDRPVLTSFTYADVLTGFYDMKIIDG